MASLAIKFVFNILLVCYISYAVSAEKVCGNSSDPALVNRTDIARQSAIKWLADQRLFDGRWPYISTQTAVFSLQLADPSWFANLDRDSRTLISERLDLELLRYLMPGYKSNLRNIDVGAGVLAQYLLALQSTCRPITSFYGVDLPFLQGHQTRQFPRDNFNNFFQYGLAVIALCSAYNGTVDWPLLNTLVRGNRGHDACASPFGHGDDGHNTDILSMMVMAMSCAKDSVPRWRRERYNDILNERVNCIKEAQKDDGSFGNAISTALAAQALISAQEQPSTWNCSMALEFVLNAQESDGSFGDLGSTIQILPLLAGRTYASLNTAGIKCSSDLGRPRPPAILPGNETLTVTLTVENLVDPGNGASTQVIDILEGENVYYAMLRAEETTDGAFRFDSKPSQWGQSLQSINGIAVNPSKKQYWTILIGPDRHWAPSGIEGLYPATSGEEYIFQMKQF